MHRPFRKLLADRQREVNSLVCVGLDPLIEKLPEILRERGHALPRALLVWMCRIVDAVAPYTSMFKPQHAHWEAIPNGVCVLRELISYIHEHFQGIPVFMDCKRGDIDRTQAQYREAHFGLEWADGMNYNGYMGRDTLKSLIDPAHLGRGLVGLGRTSNPDAWEIQDAVLADGRTVWEFMVERLHAWSEELEVIENAGVVMGAAHKNPKDSRTIYSSHLVRAREIVGDDMWFLIPGIGTQGGFIEETVRAAFRGPGSISVNSSSAIIFASSGPDFATAAAAKAKELRDQLQIAGGSCS
jgi:orotidine-5'-phosphate decarboxylase